LKNRRSSWVQLSGHPGSFAPAGLGTLWKKQGADNNEQVVYEALMKDSASDIVPKYYRDVSYQGESNFFFFRSLFSHSLSSPCTLYALPLHGASGRNGRAINNVKFPHIPQSNGRVFSFFLTRNVKGDKII
jgi:hypothetical protein